MSSLTGLNCLITGASRGLGARLAEVFWEAGASLAVVARSSEQLAELVQRLPGRRDQVAFAITADLSDPGSTGRVHGIVRERFRELHVLVNSAGLQGPIGLCWDNGWDEWGETIQTNLLTPVDLCRHFVPEMGKSRRGKIINISGGGATGPRPRFSAYAAAKCALVRFSETLAAETHDVNIDVNCVAPGAMNTAMTALVIEAGPDVAGEDEYAAALRTQKTGGSMDRAVALCKFLASSESDGVTGKLISALWDPWQDLPKYREELAASDVFSLRRIVPADRGLEWGDTKLATD